MRPPRAVAWRMPEAVFLVARGADGGRRLDFNQRGIYQKKKEGSKCAPAFTFESKLTGVELY
ncbi:MAG: hypothetical protein DWQ49_08965 [Bacteroidetes bacterium]|mgnify:FL=1|nr:MAG: hypothetical protein DWQ49_08965 [Bacteroidota bacterium]